MIVVTGATGVVGGVVAREPAARGLPFRMVVRDPERAPALPGAEVAVAAYDDPDALAAALEAGITFYDGVARGEADVVGHDYRELTGRPPLSIRELIEQDRDDLPLARKERT